MRADLSTKGTGVRYRKPRHGEGTAWLVADPDQGDYLCYWYAGPSDGLLVGQARAATATEAVAWGRLRTPRVRIRTTDACAYWAGTAPRPEGFSNSWSDPDGMIAPSSPGDPPQSGEPVVERVDGRAKQHQQTKEPIHTDPQSQVVGAGTGGSSC
ncbi:MAG TPA: hypothetical protein VLL25_11560 [Acidimicrobiales bacterium]|nr:hypothetical protein [Acidimicrobiales bacterium]